MTPSQIPSWTSQIPSWIGAGFFSILGGCLVWFLTRMGTHKDKQLEGNANVRIAEIQAEGAFRTEMRAYIAELRLHIQELQADIKELSDQLDAARLRHEECEREKSVREKANRELQDQLYAMRHGINMPPKSGENG